LHFAAALALAFDEVAPAMIGTADWCSAATLDFAIHLPPLECPADYRRAYNRSEAALTLPEAKQTTNNAATNLWLVALLAAFVILPVFLVDIPAMKDYPNHLARMYLLSAIGTPAVKVCL
jgi:hypothetical protein